MVQNEPKPHLAKKGGQAVRNEVKTCHLKQNDVHKWKGNPPHWFHCKQRNKYRITQL
jgi:hypothetical protein